MTRGQAYPSKYLSKEDVMTPVIATMDFAQTEEFENDSGKKAKPVLYFADETKPWVIPNCSWMEIEALYGTDSDDWKGKQIELFCDASVMFGNKRVGGVRCRGIVARPQARPVQQQRRPVPNTNAVKKAAPPPEVQGDDVPSDDVPF